MLFINISSDKVQIADAQQEIFLDRKGIETSLGKTLIEWYKQSPFKEIFLLNGPGSFTNLRVGTLIINLFNKLLNFQYKKKTKIYSLTKFDLYSYLRKQGFLPLNGIIYIGQRDNVWIYDAKHKTYKQIKKEDIPKKEAKNLFFDFVQDEYWGLNTSNMLCFSMTKKGLKISRRGNSMVLQLTDLCLQAQSQVKPEYMIEAVVS